MGNRPLTGLLSAVSCCRFLALLSVLSVPLDSCLAAGELMVAPTRLVFEGRTRTAQVTLMNTGGEKTTYRIEFVRKRMTESGGFEAIEKPLEGERFAEELIRFSPRQVTLGPGQAQVVRLLLRKPPHLESGEYRSHLLFRSIPNTNTIENSGKNTGGGINIQLVPILAISIPIIIRHGDTHADVSLKQLRVVSAPQGRTLNFAIEREGDQSVFGDLTATFTPSGAQPRVVGQANGVAVYTPLSRRLFRLPLQLPAELIDEGGVLDLIYRARPEEGGALIAGAKLKLP